MRTFKRQKLDVAYIRHYLQETYQVDNATIDQVLEKCGLGDVDDGGPAGGGKKPNNRAQQFFR